MHSVNTIPILALYIRSLTTPVSITYLISGIVIEVSAIFVAKIIYIHTKKVNTEPFIYANLYKIPYGNLEEPWQMLPSAYLAEERRILDIQATGVGIINPQLHLS